MRKARKILLSKRYCAWWLEGWQIWKMKILRKLQTVAFSVIFSEAQIPPNSAGVDAAIFVINPSIIR